MDFFRRRYSWRKLENLLTRLPVSSAYREAMLNDPEFAELLAAQSNDGPPPSPAWSEYSPIAARLDGIFDRLGDVMSAVVASGGGKPPRIQPARRPVTEVDRARLRREKKAHEDLVADVKAAQERWKQARREGSDAAGN